MGRDTAIAWTDHTFNPWWGCTHRTKLCVNCYAEKLATRRGWAQWGIHGTRYIPGADTWRGPLAWHRAAVRDGVRRRVFCASGADVFEERPELDLPRSWLWPLIEATPGLDWLLLTKRPEYILAMVPAAWRTQWPAHVWIGASVGADELHFLDLLRAVPARVRFLSCEPLVAPMPAMHLDGIAQVIIGGESDPGGQFRPMEIAWMEGVAAQADAAGAAVFIKQDAGRWPDQQGRIPDHLWRRREHPPSAVPSA
jgi:protein gp37